jgi:tRNA dimethylallyltransferase
VSAADLATAIARENPEDLLTIVGPTASGKTALAVEVAERVQGEVISADSVQIYREFDIGSGKPTAEELARAAHHLVGEIDPLDSVDAAAWARRAASVIASVRARGHVPVVCGGTFLWVKALLYGLAEAPSGNDGLRERLRRLAEAEGRHALHARLRTIDPDSADRLHPNDFVRVSRALEVYELTGKPLSAWQREHGFGSPRYAARLVAIACPPEDLTLRIRARVRGWLAQGWADEVRALLRRGYRDARAMGSVGYSQVRAAVEGELPWADLEETIVRATRVFARRQRTWLNHAEVTWLPPG